MLGLLSTASVSIERKRMLRFFFSGKKEFKKGTPIATPSSQEEESPWGSSMDSRGSNKSSSRVGSSELNTVSYFFVNPLRPNNDVSQTSHCNIKGVSVSEVIRIENMITQVQFY